MTAAPFDPTAPVSASTTSSSNWIPAGVALAFAGVIAVMVLTPLPPLLDYPNHLVRFWLLAGGKHVAPLRSMYRIDWSLASTNIGIDLSVAVLSKLLPFQAVAKLVLIAAVAGPPAGAVLLSRVVFGRWTWWQITLPILAWTTTALFGFLSYQVAIALALIFACLEPALDRRPIAGAFIRMAAGVLILVFHPFGLLFYAALIIALAIGPKWEGLTGKDRLARAAWGVAASALVLIVPLLILMFTSHNLPGANLHSGAGLIGWARITPYMAILTTLSPLLTYKASVDVMFVMPAIALCLWAAIERRLTSHAGLLITGIAIGLLALVMPFSLGDAAWLTRRLPLMAAFMICAGLLPDPWPSRWGRRALAALSLLLVVGRSAWIADVWSARDRDVRAVEAVLSRIPAGAAMFAVQSEPENLKNEPVGRYLAGIPELKSETTLRHVPALVVVERHAFIPTLFAVPGQQPLRVLPPWKVLSTPGSVVPDVHVLDRPPTALDLEHDPYIAHWRDRFDYIVLIGADQNDRNGPFNPPAGLTLAADERYAKLYRVVR